MDMRLVLLALLAGVALGQASDDAATLIQEVAERANNAKGWNIEGSVHYAKSDFDDDPIEEFSLQMRSPGRTRFEQMGTRSPALIICDGYSSWVYSPPLNRYRKSPSVDGELCSPIVEEWKMLPLRLHSPVLAGTCGPDPSSKSASFTLIRGSSEPEVSSAGKIKRTLCIDANRRLIIWDKWESRYTHRIYVYSTVLQTDEFASDTFVFQPPRGSVQTDFELPTPRPLGTRGMLMAPGVTLPRLKSRVEPSYGEASRRAHIQGVVVLYVVIDAQGTLSEILFYRRLSPDLDLEAVRAVRKWRFTPGERDGHPAAIPAAIEVNFRLAR